MCGRYTITVTLEELLVRYGIEEGTFTNYRPRYNVAPGQMVIAVIHDGKRNRMGELKWGLVPSWAKDESAGNKMINARAETLAEKPAYRLPFERKRCLIPADGFYEWKRVGGRKQPMRIVLNDGAIFSMAGLYDTWTAPDGRKVSSCTIVTTEPNRLVADIHNRMPVILRPEDEALWLDRTVTDIEKLKPLLKPFPAERMTVYPVSELVGNVQNDIPACIAKREP
mgnify:CR=1 FL=1